MEFKQLELDDDRSAWEQQSWETGPAFRAFVIYRDLGPNRSLAKAAKDVGRSMVRSSTAKTAERQYEGWSARHHWIQRARGYDMHMDARYREQRETAIDQQNRRYAALAARMSGAALRKVAATDDAALDKMVDVLDFEELARAVERLQKVERLATGQALGEIGKGMFSMTNAEVGTHLRNLVKIGLQYAAPDIKPAYAHAIRTYMSTGKLPDDGGPD